MSGSSKLLSHNFKGSFEGEFRSQSSQNFEIELSQGQAKGSNVVYGISVAYGLVFMAPASGGR